MIRLKVLAIGIKHAHDEGASILCTNVTFCNVKYKLVLSDESPRIVTACEVMYHLATNYGHTYIYLKQ